MKYGNDYYLQLSRHLFADKYKDMSINAKWLYVVLNELEQRFTGKDKDWFFRTDEERGIFCEYRPWGDRRRKSPGRRSEKRGYPRRGPGRLLHGAPSGRQSLPGA